MLNRAHSGRLARTIQPEEELLDECSIECSESESCEYLERYFEIDFSSNFKTGLASQLPMTLSAETLAGLELIHLNGSRDRQISRTHNWLKARVVTDEQAECCTSLVAFLSLIGLIAK